MTPEDTNKIIEQLWQDPNWHCPNCQFTNLAIREKCRNCGYDSNCGEFPWYDPLPPYKGLTAVIKAILPLFLLVATLSASPITHMPIPEQPLQYWHTQWIPGDGGVYPQGVYAHALLRIEPELYVFVDIGDPPRLETPEPGTWWLVGGVVLLLIWRLI